MADRIQWELGRTGSSLEGVAQVMLHAAKAYQAKQQRQEEREFIRSREAEKYEREDEKRDRLLHEIGNLSRQREGLEPIPWQDRPQRRGDSGGILPRIDRGAPSSDQQSMLGFEDELLGEVLKGLPEASSNQSQMQALGFGNQGGSGDLSSIMGFLKNFLR